MKKILAICGSTRTSSSNLNVIAAFTALSSAIFSVELFGGLSDLPHFNPDHDTDDPPSQVKNFRKKIKEAEAVLICTPEYAMGVPGTLKNAIDWTVSSCEFSHKPTALITASSSGEKGHASLLETLKIIEADISDSTQLLMPYVKTKVSSDGKITDSGTLEEVKMLIRALDEKIQGRVM